MSLPLNKIAKAGIFLLFSGLLICCKKDEGTVSSGSFFKMLGTKDQEIAADIRETSDGGFLIFGTSREKPESSGKFTLIKTDASGKVLWRNSKFNFTDSLTAMRLLPVSTGWLLCGNVRQGKNSYPIVVWVNDTGVELSHQELIEKAPTLMADAGLTSSGFYVLANSRPDTVRGFYPYLYNFTGTNKSSYASNWRSNVLYSACQAPWGDFIGTGAFANEIIFRQSDYTTKKQDILLANFHSGSVQANTKIYPQNLEEAGTIIHPDGTGAFYMAGTVSSSSARGTDLFIMKTDTALNRAWYKVYGGDGEDRPISMIVLADRSIVIASNTSSYGTGTYNIMLSKYDADGNQIWQHTYFNNYNSTAAAVLHLSKGGFIICGTSNDFGNVNKNHDIIMLKVDENGVL